MSKTDAEYMRAYRARRKAERTTGTTTSPEVRTLLATELEAQIVLEKNREAEYVAKIEALEGEIVHLKRQLAGRATIVRHVEASFNSRPFTPSPKIKKG